MGRLRFINCSLSNLETHDCCFSNVTLLESGRSSLRPSRSDHPTITDYVEEVSPILDIHRPTDHFDQLQPDATVISLLRNEGNAEELTCVDFSAFHNVRSIFIATNSLVNVTSFIVKSLPSLHVLLTDKRACTKKGELASLLVEDCPELVRIRFGERSFRGFTSFSLRQCPKLRLLDCDVHCFKRARELHLKSSCSHGISRRLAGAEASEVGVQVVHEDEGRRVGE